MQNYLAKLIFNINIENGSDVSQFDEQVRLVSSTNLENAFHKARTIGKQEEETFLNTQNNPVHWKFIDVIDVYPLDTLKDGEQVFSLTHEKEDTHSFINYIRQKAMAIQTKNLTFA